MAITLEQVMQKMDTFRNPSGTGRNRAAYSELPINSISAMGWAGTHSILYRAQIQSEFQTSKKTGSPKQYLTYIQFYDLKVENAKTTKTPTPINIQGEPFWFSIPTAESRVAMSCQCSDFTFRWEKELFDVGSLIGRWRPYQRKTTTWPEVNPKHVPGFCKHVWTLIRQLSSNDLLYQR